jgi:hypothetical protein
MSTSRRVPMRPLSAHLSAPSVPPAQNRNFTSNVPIAVVNWSGVHRGLRSSWPSTLHQARGSSSQMGALRAVRCNNGVPAIVLRSAVGGEAVTMPVDQSGELFEGLQPLPFELGLPVPSSAPAPMCLSAPWLTVPTKACGPTFGAEIGLNPGTVLLF